MRRNRTRELRIRDPRQLRAIRTPLRQELLETIVRLGPVSAKELALALDRPAASLYYHIHGLEDAGLVASGTRESEGRRPESVYRAVADRIVVDRKVRSPAFARALVDLHRAALNQADREIEEALARGSADETPEGENVVLLRLTASLSRKDAREARRRLHELARFMSGRSMTGGKETLSLTAALVKVD